MAIFDFLKSKHQKKLQEQAKFLNDLPIFSQFGEDIYASDVVQNCIDVIATELSKMQPKHITTKPNGEINMPPSSINRRFKVAPNALMTTRDFIEKMTWLLYLNYNCFVYPEYESYKDSNGKWRKRFVGFWPLDPKQVDFEQDLTGKLFIHMYFANGEDYTLPYESVIHLRKKFSRSEIMGGGEDGQPDNAGLIKVLEVNDIVLQGVGKAVSTSLAIKGIIKINTMLENESQKKERENFEEKLRSGDTGILPMDLKGDFTPITIDPKAIDKDTMKFLDEKVLRWYGVSLPIISGDFNDTQYQAFYEKTLEPLMVAFGQAFTKTLFSDREIDFGNEVMFYPKNMMYMSSSERMNILKTAGEQGLLTDDQKLQLLGYPPIGGEKGNRRTQSLNFADVELVNDYQAAKANAPQLTVSGGGTSE